MKIFYFPSFILLCLLSFDLLGAVLRVNNQLATDESQKIFASIQLAHDFAQPGDTLMVEGSSTNYASSTFTKRMIVIGTGYFLADNPQTQANQLQVRINGIIYLNKGSEGSFLIGLTFLETSSLNGPNLRTNNITIIRCYLANPVVFSDNIQNIIIAQNYFRGNAISVSSSLNSFSDVVFNNNIVNGNLQTGSNENRVFSQVAHNIFRGTANNTISIRTGLFRNNVIASNASVTILGTAQNNLVVGTQLGGNSNQTISLDQLFVGEDTNSSDGQFRIKSDSPLRTAGFDGVEPGIFGGNSPYVLSGIPPVPTIYEFSAASFASQQNGLSIQLRAKTNQ